MSMNSSEYWDQSSINQEYVPTSSNQASIIFPSTADAVGGSLIQVQNGIPQVELYGSISESMTNQGDVRGYGLEDLEDLEVNEENPDHMGTTLGSNVTSSDQPSLEKVQRVYYSKGLEELDSLQLLDLSPLANWKLSSFKPGYGLSQLRNDSPDTYWQSDGSNGSNNNNNTNSNAILNNQLSNPHSITIQFSKKVSLERISIFTNFSLDESYTPSKVKIMAGSTDGWDLSEVCTVNFSKPIGWSHIIFNGIRNDGVLKCFMIKLIIVANHQDGKDSHIRAIRCFGKKSTNSNIRSSTTTQPLNNDILNDLSLNSGLTNASGFLLNEIFEKESYFYSDEDVEDISNETEAESSKHSSSKLLGNVADVIGFNSGFQSLEMKSTSTIR
jgi:anaphase-promoting complex subunit 10